MFEEIGLAKMYYGKCLRAKLPYEAFLELKIPLNLKFSQSKLLFCRLAVNFLLPLHHFSHKTNWNQDCGFQAFFKITLLKKVQHQVLASKNQAPIS